MLKREWSAGSNGKLPHLFIPSKTATLVPEFAEQNCSLGTLVRSERPALGQNTLVIIDQYAVTNATSRKQIPF